MRRACQPSAGCCRTARAGAASDASRDRAAPCSCERRPELDAASRRCALAAASFAAHLARRAPPRRLPPRGRARSPASGRRRQRWRRERSDRASEGVAPSTCRSRCRSAAGSAASARRHSPRPPGACIAPPQPTKQPTSDARAPDEQASARSARPRPPSRGRSNSPHRARRRSPLYAARRGHDAGALPALASRRPTHSMVPRAGRAPPRERHRIARWLPRSPGSPPCQESDGAGPRGLAA
eukprot:scaffold855_cov344-Prasinococcus_capsulatus_cf.AAC.8